MDPRSYETAVSCDVTPFLKRPLCVWPQVGQEIEVRPGIVSKDQEGKLMCKPIFSKIVSLFAEHNDLQYAAPGGLIGESTLTHLTDFYPLSAEKETHLLNCVQVWALRSTRHCAGPIVWSARCWAPSERCRRSSPSWRSPTSCSGGCWESAQRETRRPPRWDIHHGKCSPTSCGL